MLADVELRAFHRSEVSPTKKSPIDMLHSCDPKLAPYQPKSMVHRLNPASLAKLFEVKQIWGMTKSHLDSFPHIVESTMSSLNYVFDLHKSITHFHIFINSPSFQSHNFQAKPNTSGLWDYDLHHVLPVQGAIRGWRFSLHVFCQLGSQIADEVHKEMMMPRSKKNTSTENQFKMPTWEKMITEVNGLICHQSRPGEVLEIFIRRS